MPTPGNRLTPLGALVGLLPFALILTTACVVSSPRQPSITPTPIPSLPPPETPPPPTPHPETDAEEPEPPTGIFHVVQAGQTLWRIARAYGLTVEEIAEANSIRDPERLEVGQAIFVPGALGAVDVPPYPAPIPEPPTFPHPGPSPPATVDGYVWPVAGEVLAPFGQKRRRSVHRGVDIRAERGAVIVAARSGRVVFAGQQRGYGRVVVLDHGSDEQTVYAHNSKNLVKTGDAVERGTPVALAGRSGNATTEHVHFEVRRGGVPLDPLSLLPEPALEAKK